MELGEIGEYDIIDSIVDDFEDDMYVPLGDDDCAIVETRGGYLVASIDGINAYPLAERYVDMTEREKGHYLAQANVSDIISSGGEPFGLMPFYGLPRDFTDEQKELLMTGVHEKARKYGITAMTGDTNERDDLALVAGALGWADEDQLRPRNGAEVGDKVIVTRDVGDFPAAAYVFENDIDFETDYFEHAMLNPEIPLEESMVAHENRVGNGGIDISDGLGIDLKKLADTSEVGLRIYEDLIPVSEPVKRLGSHIDVDPRAFAFNVGGDWQSIMTMPEDDWESVRGEMNDAGKATAIGEVTDEGLKYVTEDGRETELPTGGYEAFQDGEIFPVEELIQYYEETRRA